MVYKDLQLSKNFGEKEGRIQKFQKKEELFQKAYFKYEKGLNWIL